MTETYEVEWTDVAEKDVAAIVGFIAADNPHNALQVLQTLRDKATGLYRFPLRCRIVPEFLAHGILSYRELIVSQWRIIYQILGRKVYILSVVDSRRNVEELLLQRLIQAKL
jgi:plasmid stabilization system protein ParE